MAPLYRVSLENLKTPVRVRLGDFSGKEFTAATPLPTTAVVSGSVTVTGGATAANQVLELAELTSLDAKDFATETTLAAINAGMDALNSLVPAVYDYIALTYTGANLTGVVYKTGAGGG